MSNLIDTLNSAMETLAEVRSELKAAGHPSSHAGNMRLRFEEMRDDLKAGLNNVPAKLMASYVERLGTLAGEMHTPELAAKVRGIQSAFAVHAG